MPVCITQHLKRNKVAHFLLTFEGQKPYLKIIGTSKGQGGPAEMNQILIQRADAAGFDTRSTLPTHDEPGYEFSVDGGESWQGPFASEKEATDAAFWRLANPRGT